MQREELEALRAHADIVDVIGHYLPLQRKGKVYKALCPFHDDHDPSMQIRPDRQIYKCFVCGNGGDVFSFVQNYEKISFPEAIQRVAELTGFTLQESPVSQSAPRDPQIEILHTILQETIRYCSYELMSESAQAQRTYLSDRGLSDDVLKTFEIGYNPEGDALYAFLKAKGYSEKDMVRANVIRITQAGIHDVFAGRILFPIHDRNGDPIGFSARTLDPSNPAKYVNTTETELFTKGHIVYNYHRARLAARRAGRVYVCEGVTDVIAFWRAGVENAVCTLGTACTDEQIRLLKRIAAKVVFCYDGDRAGQAATVRAGKMARAAGCDIAVVSNDTGLDPDEILKKNGKEGLQNLLKMENSWMEFYLKYLQKETNLSNFTEKKEFAEKAMAEIQTLSDEMERNYFADEVWRLTGIRTGSYIQQPSYREKAAPRTPVRTVPNGTQTAEETILRSMFQDPSAVSIFENDLGYLLDPVFQETAMMIVDEVHARRVCDPKALMAATDSQPVRDCIASIVTADSYDEPYSESVLNGAIRKVKMTVLRRRKEEYRKQLGGTLNDESRRLIEQKYEKCVKELRRYIDEEKRNS